jgi:outer membrane biosynthesis protein TonB
VEQSSGSPRLDNAAVQWVKQRWRYEPAMLGTVPVSSAARVNLTFKL